MTPTGFGPLGLGMTEDELAVLGAVRSAPEPAGCRRAQLTIDEVPGDAWLSRTAGLAAVSVPAGTSTPEGLSTGSTLAEWRAAYPRVNGSGTTYRAAASDTTVYVLTVVEGGYVDSVEVALTDSYCPSTGP